MTAPDPIRDIDRSIGVLMGAALGDVLGWPNENRANRVGRSNGNAKLEFGDWVKRSGGRFHPYEEVIEAGAYSDDTQLQIATARTRLSGGKWWFRLARVELPFWTAYERGGGGASLRAARLLLKGTLPWESAQEDRQKYFGAGGNGVAMRIAPHVLINAHCNDFSKIAAEIIADGVLTHGHPVALTGALAYGFALWSALQQHDTLPFGGLVRRLQEGLHIWAPIPAIEAYWPTWLSAAKSNSNYSQEWESAVSNLRVGLLLVQRSLDEGALAIEEETLRALGCFEPKTNGSGTVSALAAIFLASKHAASPFEGVARAALARGADTDTLASMTGALAGAIAGSEWVNDRANHLQDAAFIANLGRRLANSGSDTEPAPEPVTERRLTKWKALLRERPAAIELPIGGMAAVASHAAVRSKSTRLATRAWRLTGANGQTFVLKDFATVKPASDREPGLDFQGGQSGPLPERVYETAQISSREPAGAVGRTAIVGIALSVHDLALSREFYEDLLGLTVSRASNERVQLGPMLVLQKETYGSTRQGLTVFVEVADVRRCRKSILDRIGIPASPIMEKSGRTSFACQDPDGYHLEIFQRNGSAATAF